MIRHQQDDGLIESIDSEGAKSVADPEFLKRLQSAKAEQGLLITILVFHKHTKLQFWHYC